MALSTAVDTAALSNAVHPTGVPATVMPSLRGGDVLSP